MKTPVCTAKSFPARRNRVRIVILSVVICGCVVLSPGVRTQTPPPGVMIGTTLSASLRNAATATRSQADVVAAAAQAWARQASSAHYRDDLFLSDFRTIQLQFQALHERFNWMGNLALQANRPYAQNTLAELEAGLNIVHEQLVFIEQQYVAGNLDQATLVRTCKTFQELIGEWDNELRRGCSRMGVF